MILICIKEVSIHQIDRNKKNVTDSNGQVHPYDLLILATGSRATVLKTTPNLHGIFTMRNRLDADEFKKHITPEKGKVVIVGGGLLGIELAASLNEIDFEVAVVQRSRD